MLLSLLLLSVAPSHTVRTLHLKNVAPTTLTQQLIDPVTLHPLAGTLERLTPDDTRKTLTLMGDTEAVKTVEQVVHWLDIRKPQVEIEAEVVDAPDAPFKGKVLIPQNEHGTLTLLGKNSRLQFQLVPHLNRDGTCSLRIQSEQQITLPTTPPRIARTGTTAFVRGALGKPLRLALDAGFLVDGSVASYKVHLTPRLKK